MFHFDPSAVVFLDETGENAEHNKLMNAKALEWIERHKEVVKHLEVPDKSMRVLVFGTVEKHGNIGGLRFQPMDGFSFSEEAKFEDAMFNREPFK